MTRDAGLAAVLRRMRAAPIRETLAVVLAWSRLGLRRLVRGRRCERERARAWAKFHASVGADDIAEESGPARFVADLAAGKFDGERERREARDMLAADVAARLLLSNPRCLTRRGTVDG